ncbi:MAG TPA: Cof-type HAD-IIB family hydrolase [Candidatus Coprousia avicola]|nr:Cof-type HAD-IIB family hydrolase [Candidatus Coprousia avicola]
MDVKAVMCDVDGTLLTSEHAASPRTVAALRRAREQGILVGLCTGRDVIGTEKMLEAWGLAGAIDAIVGSGGAELRDYGKDVFELNYPLAGDAIKEIMAHFTDLPVSFVIPYHGVLYTTADDWRVRRLSKVDGLPFEVVDFDGFLTEPRPKLMLACAPEDLQAVVERAQTFSSESYRSASLITSARLYEYMDPRITKTFGLAKLMGLHAWTLDDLLVFGDADNDCDMVANAGVGVVMGNGSEKTKAAADYVTADNDHDGIAVFLEEHVLAQVRDGETGRVDPPRI